MWPVNLKKDSTFVFYINETLIPEYKLNIQRIVPVANNLKFHHFIIYTVYVYILYIINIYMRILKLYDFI